MLHPGRDRPARRGRGSPMRSCCPTPPGPEGVGEDVRLTSRTARGGSRRVGRSSPDADMPTPRTAAAEATRASTSTFRACSPTRSGSAWSWSTTRTICAGADHRSARQRGDGRQRLPHPGTAAGHRCQRQPLAAGFDALGAVVATAIAGKDGRGRRPGRPRCRRAAPPSLRRGPGGGRAVALGAHSPSRHPPLRRSSPLVDDLDARDLRRGRRRAVHPYRVLLRRRFVARCKENGPSHAWPTTAGAGAAR